MTLSHPHRIDPPQILVILRQAESTLLSLFPIHPILDYLAPLLSLRDKL